VLIGKQQARVFGERTCERDRLPLAA